MLKQFMRFFHFQALLELDRPAILNKAVALVCLPKQGQSVSAGKYCSITGKFVIKITLNCCSFQIMFAFLLNTDLLFKGGVELATIVPELQFFKRLAFLWHSKTRVRIT